MTSLAASGPLFVMVMVYGILLPAVTWLGALIATARSATPDRNSTSNPPKPSPPAAVLYLTLSWCLPGMAGGMTFNLNDGATPGTVVETIDTPSVSCDTPGGSWPGPSRVSQSPIANGPPTMMPAPVACSHGSLSSI